MGIPIPRRAETMMPSNERIVVRERERAPDDAMANALADTGAAVNEIATRVRESQIASDIALAEIDTRSSLDRELRKLQNDPALSPQEISRRYDENARQIIARTSQPLTSPMHRRLWDARAEGIRLDGQNSAARIAMERGAINARAQITQISATYREMAQDPATSPDTLAASEMRLREAIEYNRNRGILPADDAAVMLAEIDVAAGEARSLRHRTILDGAMDSGQWALAREHFNANAAEMTPRDRAAYETVIEERGREAEAFQRADQFWTASGGDYGRALEAARSIGNMDERRAVEGRIAELKAQDDAARQGAQRDAASGAWDHVLTGGSLSTMPSDIMAGLSGQERIQIRDYVERRRQDMADRAARAGSAEAAPQISEALSTEMGNMILAEVALLPGGNTMTLGQMQEASPRTFEMFEMLRPDDQVRVLTQMTQRTTEGVASPAVDTLFRSLTQAATLRIPPPATGTMEKAQRDLRDLASAQEPDDGGWTDAERVLRQHLYIQAEQWARDNPGQDPTPQQRREMISRAYTNSNPARFPQRVNVLDPENIGIDPVVARQAADLAREALGREPTNEEVLTYYRQIMAGEE